MEERPYIDHYSDLRKRVIYSLLFFISFFILSFASVKWSIPFLAKNQMLVMLGPMDVLQLYIRIAGTLALGFSIPFFSLQLWKFLRPALNDEESKIALRYIPGIFVSFIIGISFGYFIFFPIIYQFLLELGQLHFEMMVTANEYFSFLLMSTLPFGFLFELPITLMFLTSLGIVTPDKLTQIRKYAYFSLIVISVLITPPDLISDVLVILPLIILYEVGVILSKMVQKREETSLKS
jgi:sec-independent protein translocase protein TatC